MWNILYSIRISRLKLVGLPVPKISMIFGYGVKRLGDLDHIYSPCTYTVTLKPGLGFTQGHPNYTIRSGTMTSYYRSIATVGLSGTISEIKGDFVENR